MKPDEGWWLLASSKLFVISGWTPWCWSFFDIMVVELVNQDVMQSD